MRRGHDYAPTTITCRALPLSCFTRTMYPPPQHNIPSTFLSLPHQKTHINPTPHRSPPLDRHQMKMIAPCSFITSYFFGARLNLMGSQCRYEVMISVSPFPVRRCERAGGSDAYFVSSVFMCVCGEVGGWRGLYMRFYITLNFIGMDGWRKIENVRYDESSIYLIVSSAIVVM